MLHKKFPKCVSIPEILLFILKKSSYFKTALHRKKAEILARQGKSAGIIGVLPAFLTTYGMNKRLFEAIYPYAALPKGGSCYPAKISALITPV